MTKTAKLLILIFFLVLFSTYSPNNILENKSIIFPIKKIEIQNLRIIESKAIQIELDYLKDSSLLFIQNENLQAILEKNEFVKSFNLKKIYPNTIKIFIDEKIPVAIYFDKKKKFFLFEDGTLATYKNISNLNDLPLVYGQKIKFKSFFLNLKKTQFPLKNVKAFQYFGIGRWDIVLKSNKTIKLPVKNYLKSLENFLIIKNNKNFTKYEIFDYRISDQLILN